MNHKKKNPFEIGRDEKTGKFMSVKDAKKKRNARVETYNRPESRNGNGKQKEVPFIRRTRSKASRPVGKQGKKKPRSS